VSPPIPPLKIQFEDDWEFSVPPEDYMIDYVEPGLNGEPDQNFCILGVNGVNFNFYILGDSFLRSYLTVYDFETLQVGIGIHKSSLATVAKHVEKNVWMVPLVVVVTLLILLTVGIYFYRRYQ
jgi:hypothetical protein